MHVCLINAWKYQQYHQLLALVYHLSIHTKATCISRHVDVVHRYKHQLFLCKIKEINRKPASKTPCNVYQITSQKVEYSTPPHVGRYLTVWRFLSGFYSPRTEETRQRYRFKSHGTIFRPTDLACAITLPHRALRLMPDNRSSDCFITAISYMCFRDSSPINS